MNFPILLDSIDNRVRNLYHGWFNGLFAVNKSGVLVYKAAWTYGPEVAQVLNDLSAWEKAEARSELVRYCYSERIVGLLRDRKISARVHRRAGPQASRDCARLLEEESKRGRSISRVVQAIPIRRYFSRFRRRFGHAGASRRLSGEGPPLSPADRGRKDHRSR